MYNVIIIAIFIFLVINLQNTDCEVVYECCEFTYSWDHFFPENNEVTNIWCEKQCKAHAANYQYSGTIKSKCYCHATKPTCIDSTQMFTCTYRFSCPGHYLEKCGGYYLKDWIFGITVSKIGQSTPTVTNQQTPSVSSRESTTADFMNIITTVLSPAPVTQGTPSTIPELFSTTSESANTAISTLVTKTSIQAQIGIRQKKLLCKCPKRLINTKWHFLDGKNITDSEVKQIVLEDFNKNIKSEISVDKKTVSKELRKKNSSVNKRKSSQSIGWGCIVLLILPVVFLIAIDILNCCIHYQSRLCDRKRNRIGPTSDIQDSRDSSKPLQENANITESYYAIRCGNDFHPDEVKLETYQRRRDDNNEEDRDKWLQYM